MPRKCGCGGVANKNYTSEGANRRTFLKRASSAGAGIGIATNYDRTISKSRTKFVNTGIIYHIEDNTTPEFVDDCAPPKWEMVNGDMYLYEGNMTDIDITKVTTGQLVVAAMKLYRPPIGDVALSKSVHLPTVVDEHLQPRKGVLFDHSYTPPVAKISESDDSIIISVGNVTRRVPPDTEKNFTLNTTTVGLRRFNKQVVDGGEVTYEKRTIESKVIPEVRIRNYGETTFHTVKNQFEVN